MSESFVKPFVCKLGIPMGHIICSANMKIGVF